MASPQCTSFGWLNNRPPTAVEPTGTRSDDVPIKAIELYDSWTDSSAGDRYLCIDPTPNALIWQLLPHSSGALAFPSSPIVVGSTSAGTATYTVQAGRYEKIGSQISIIILLNWTGHTGTGSMSIGNLPITPNTTFPCVGMAKLQNITLPLLSLMTWGKTNTTTGRIDLTTSIAGTVDSLVAMSASGTINLNMIYIP